MTVHVSRGVYGFPSDECPSGRECYVSGREIDTRMAS